MGEAGCPFCNYSGPSEVIHEWGDAYVIEPINPVTEGHVLVVSKEHVGSFTASSAVTARAMQRAVQYASIKVRGDCNLITSKGEAATQTVRHLHIHVIPRKQGDGLALPWTELERERWEKETRERLEAAGLKDLLFQEAIKHLSFESPEDQEEYVWGLVNGVVSTILDAIFDKGEGDG